MNHVVNSGCSASVAIAPTVLQMVAAATAATTTSNGDSAHSTTKAYFEESYLANECLELWSTLARHSPM
jgi:hypothetical protein